MSKWTKNLTPQQAWNYYYSDSVDKFISDMEAGGITDIKAMCKRFAQDIPWVQGRPVDQEDIDYMAQLFEQHMRQYIKKIGGRDKLIKYTKEELDREWEEGMDDVINKLRKAGILQHKDT